MSPNYRLWSQRRQKDVQGSTRDVYVVKHQKRTSGEALKGSNGELASTFATPDDHSSYRQNLRMLKTDWLHLATGRARRMSYSNWVIVKEAEQQGKRTGHEAQRASLRRMRWAVGTPFSCRQLVHCANGLRRIAVAVNNVRYTRKPYAMSITILKVWIRHNSSWKNYDKAAEAMSRLTTGRPCKKSWMKKYWC